MSEIDSAKLLESALERWGSAKALAPLLHVQPSTIRCWRTRGAVPPSHLPTLQHLASADRREDARRAGGDVAMLAPKSPALPVEALPPGHRLKGVSSLVDEGGNVHLQWVKTTRDADTREEILRRLLREIPAEVPRAPVTPEPRGFVDPERMAVYPLGDPHVGLLAWGRETGADFDLEICENLMVGAMRDLVLRGPRAERALIVNLGDFFHFDNAAMHTTRGDHALDVDGRAPKVLAVGFRIMRELVFAALEHHKHVTVDCRIGNHDAHTALLLSIALAAYFENEPRVSCPQTIQHRGYHEFGKVLIGTTHGDRAKPADLPAIMAAERPEAWGRTAHRVWLTGHVHHYTSQEFRGCRVETFRTLAASDSWHAAQGYIAGRDMHRIVFHRDHGEVSREIVNVAALLAGTK